MVIARFGAPAVLTLACASAALGCSLLYSADNISGSRNGHDAGGDGSEGGTIDGGPSGCTLPFVFCDDFENGLTQWSLNTGDGVSVKADTTRFHRGKFALHVQMPAITDATGTLRADVLRRQTWPLHVFIRFFVYLPSPWTHATANLLEFATADGKGFALYLPFDTPTPSITTFGNAVETGQHSLTEAPRDTWSCYEVDADRSNQTLQAYVEGTPLGNVVQNAQLGVLENMAFGLDYSATRTGGTYEGWIDDVIVDTSRIGCDR
jgi:hypothetical protein